MTMPDVVVALFHPTAQRRRDAHPTIMSHYARWHFSGVPCDAQ